MIITDVWFLALAGHLIILLSADWYLYVWEVEIVLMCLVGFSHSICGLKIQALEKGNIEIGYRVPS